MKIQVSINSKIINKTKILSEMGKVDNYYNFEIEDFINKIIKKGVAWSAPKFKNNLRLKKNFLYTNIIGIDIDDGLSIQDVLKNNFVKNNALFLYTTVNHSSSKNKFRIIFQLPKIINDIKVLEQIISILIKKLNADNNCRDCSRLFYGNTKALIKIFGKKLNLNTLNLISAPPSFPIVNKNNKISKSLDYLLRNKSNLNDMLTVIKKNFCTLKYEEWITLCSSIWSIFSYDESIDILQNFYPEKKESDYQYKYEHKLTTIPFTYIIKLAIKCGFKIPNYQDFVRFDSKGKIIITPISIDQYLTNDGFFTYFYNNNEVDYQIIKENKNILTEIGLKKICEHIKNYTLKNYKKNDAEEILNYIVNKNCISVKTLNYLQSSKFEIHRDTINSSFFYFQNGFLEITKNNLIFHENYSKLNNFKLWKNNKKNKQFYIDNKESVFEQFLMKISNTDQERFDILKGVIGYLLHKFKNPNINKCVVLNDEKINIDNPTGRTGKSLIAQALSYVRNVMTLDGRNFDIKDRFIFQNVELSTEVINIDDVSANFNLKSFYSILTGDLKIEKKGEHALIIPFEKSPKFIFSSNYTVDTGGGSDRARVIEISLYNYYNEYNQPKHEFGHSFFYDWDQKEWNRFFTFCALCVQKYLKIGMINTISNSLLVNKITKQTTEKFALWINKYNFFDEKKSFFSQKELFDDFNNNQKEQFDPEFITKHQFTKNIKLFLNIMEIPYKFKCFRPTNQNPIWGYQIINR